MSVSLPVWLRSLEVAIILLLSVTLLPGQEEARSNDDRTLDGAVANEAEVDVVESEAEETVVVVPAPAAVREPQVLESLVDRTLGVAQVRSTGNTPAHYGIAAAILLGAFILRRVVVRGVFWGFVRLARRTRTELDERLVGAMERPAMTLVTLVGLVAALRVLKLPPSADIALTWLSTLAFSLLVLVTVLRLIGALLDHAQYRAGKRRLSVGAFLPWMRRTVYALVVVIGVLLIAQSLGANVRAFLAGLGIGGLAVALAAQDTLANIFGSIVIAVDQPFRIGETIQVGAHIGTVEDMGLRSTRLRTPAGHLITIPNKTVAAESISNLTRFTRRRVEQTLRLAQTTTPAQLQQLVQTIRELILAEAEVEQSSVITHFTEIGPASLDIWIAYNTRGPDFLAQVRLKERLNLAILQTIARHGASFAPTQRMQSEAPAAARDAAKS